MLLYRLRIDGTAVGNLADGNGASIWIQEGASGVPVRERFIGRDELGGNGDEQEYTLVYRGQHAADTRFIFMHRVPSSSTITGTDSMGDAYDNWDIVEQDELKATAILTPTIRKVIS